MCEILEQPDTSFQSGCRRLTHVAACSCDCNPIEPYLQFPSWLRESQSNTPKLVRTPLTDRCCLTLAQGMAPGLGGNPFGPARTGKVESVRALGQVCTLEHRNGIIGHVTHEI